MIYFKFVLRNHFSKPATFDALPAFTTNAYTQKSKNNLWAKPQLRNYSFSVIAISLFCSVYTQYFHNYDTKNAEV